ncbi:GNAT family N-acetyltransferase [Tunicatimonas pelagia]|uniref:GNAT family N-acetyltransferase n=1 Tax=Tunicatimonas pelagia TaxID=931531 RepID=UPI0026671966|nr:GNAT family N-acetyltransferase [Tunicatimonas pelagia]WKN42389.1 GNAT family N-acetyltransferase [Tunicatimonas pelagia]
MEFIIRQATVDDIPLLNQLAQFSIRQLGGKYYSPQQVESSLKYLFGVDTRIVLDGTYYAVEEAGKVVACGGWSRRKTPFGGDQASDQLNFELRNPAVDPAVIRAFYVHPDWARQGIARQLLHHCETQALRDGFNWFELTATLSGFPFYSRYGYHETGKVAMTLPDSVTIPGMKMVKHP